jgi:hypothetical protein
MVGVLKLKLGCVVTFVLSAVFGWSSVRADPPMMTEVVFPVDTESVVTAIGVAGGTILLLVFGLAIGFRLVKKLYERSMMGVCDDGYSEWDDVSEEEQAWRDRVAASQYLRYARSEGRKLSRSERAEIIEDFRT